jgi:hypothetical protein
VSLLKRIVWALERACSDVLYDDNLRCETCHAQHVDRGEWALRPHKRHLCAHCGRVWEPFEAQGYDYSFGVESPPLPPHCGAP